MSQKELGELLKVAQTTVSGWENHGKEPSYDILMKLATNFGVNMDYLLGRTDDPTPVGLAAPALVSDTSEDPRLASVDLSDLEDLTPEEADKVTTFARFVKSERSLKKEQK